MQLTPKLRRKTSSVSYEDDPERNANSLIGDAIQDMNSLMSEMKSSKTFRKSKASLTENGVSGSYGKLTKKVDTFANLSDIDIKDDGVALKPSLPLASKKPTVKTIVEEIPRSNSGDREGKSNKAKV